MTPTWTTTTGLPAGGTVIWTGRHRGLLADGLDEWHCGRVDLYARLDVAPELIILDALNFPWDALRPQDRDIPLVVALPPELDAVTIPLVLGPILFQHLTPYDRLIEGRSEVRQAVSGEYTVCPDVWLDGDTAHPEKLLAVVQDYARAGLDEVTTDIGTFVLPAGDLITRQLREFGAHQRGDLNALLALVRDDDIVFDIGAHVGTFAIPIACHLGAAGRVVAFEGHPDTFRLLAHNVELNKVGDKAEAHRTLLGAPDSLPRSPVLHAENTGGTWFRHASVADRDTVPTVTLDSWNEARENPVPPTFIKLDVEGGELAVLQGAERTISAYRPLLMVEVANVQLERQGVVVRQLDRWFTDHDYDLFVSTGARNTTAPDYRLESLESLIGYDEHVFDVIAVPKDSDRRPEIRP